MARREGVLGQAERTLWFRFLKGIWYSVELSRQQQLERELWAETVGQRAKQGNWRVRRKSWDKFPGSVHSEKEPAQRKNRLETKNHGSYC